MAKGKGRGEMVQQKSKSRKEVDGERKVVRRDKDECEGMVKGGWKGTREERR